MSDIFIHLLNMSITASYLVLVTILLRLIFRKAPKTVFCFLWILVGVVYDPPLLGISLPLSFLNFRNS